MLIDWFTVAVQIVNFFVLIGLLKHFLYGPILRAMDERQRSIEESLAEAARAKREAEAQVAALASAKEALASSREALMRQAVNEVESWREKTLVRLRAEIEENRRLWQRQLAEDQDSFFETLKIRLGEQVVRVSSRVLADLADDWLEARLLARFLVRMGTGSVIDDGPGHPEPKVLLVTTGRALTPEGREALRGQLTTLFGSGKPILFKEEPGVVVGIRLSAGDQIWEWNLAHYMAELEHDIRQALSVVRKSGENDG